MNVICKCKGVVCTAPITCCEYWEGTFCSYDIQQEQEEQKLSDDMRSQLSRLERQSYKLEGIGSIPLRRTTFKR